MADKVQKIREEVVRLHNLLPVMDGDNISVNYADRICTALKMYIDSLQNEPVSEDLEKAAINYMKTENPPIWGLHDGFIAGANWQKQQMMKDAIEGIARPDDSEIWCNLAPFNLKDGDKVRVVVIKED